MNDAHVQYARLLIQTGVNLQPGQPLSIGAELGHREFVRILAEEAYKAGALFVDVDWSDALTRKQRFTCGDEAHLDYAPDYWVARGREYLERKFARLSLAGDEFPDAFEDVDPTRMRRARAASQHKLSFYMDAMMGDAVQWCVAGVPTPAWAARVFPGLTPDAAVARLWEVIFDVTRMKAPDPVAAWRAHDARLRGIAAALMRERVRTLRFVDADRADDGRPRTDLTVGLTAAPIWVAASSTTPDGVSFLPNMPTEETFTTPHAARTRGWARTSRPVTIMDHELRDAWFQFEDGVVVAFGARQGQDALGQLFEIQGARRLGEVALVDVDSPINQSGLVFGDTLFDENAVCHIAFGKAYPIGIEGGRDLSEDALKGMGMNVADTHADVMIGTPTMDVTGIREDGSTVAVMKAGHFVMA